MGIRHRLRPLGNGELETCTSSRANSFLDGHGDLVNRVTKSTGPIGHVTYGSTRLVTREKFNQAQGHWEGRIMVTPEAGVWPAWWALGTSKPWAAGGEIDFFEDSGTTGWHAAAHCPAANINSTCSPWTASFTSTAPTGRSARSRSPSTARFMTIDRIHVPDWPCGPGKRFCMIINIGSQAFRSGQLRWLPVPCRNGRQPRSCLALGDPNHLIHRRHTCRDG